MLFQEGKKQDKGKIIYKWPFSFHEFVIPFHINS